MADGARQRRDIVALGASAGGVPVLLGLASALPKDFPASLLVVQHIGAHPSALPELMRAAGPNPAVHPRNGDPLEHGRIYIAPPDQHMLVVGGHIRLSREAKENHARPAIDPLFRSIAINHGPRAIGVVLSGRLDDGTAGLQAIKACGGTVVVQDPADAEEPGMPSSAMDNVSVDHVVRRDTLASTLAGLVRELAPATPEVPRSLACEYHLTLGDRENPMEDLDAIGTPSKIVCPDCNGVLWEITGSQPRRYRCHTGHAYTEGTLEYTQRVRMDEALWNALRAMQERECLLRSMADIHRNLGRGVEVERLEAEAAHLADHAAHLQRMVANA
jgi:two-component system chemotaxis response regulator CheB